MLCKSSERGNEKLGNESSKKNLNNDNDEKVAKTAINFDHVRLVLHSAYTKGLIVDERYDGKTVSILGLFIHHGFSTREIAFFASMSEPAVRRHILHIYEKVIRLDKFI